MSDHKDERTVGFREARIRITCNPLNHYVIGDNIIYSEATYQFQNEMDLTVLQLPCTEKEWGDWLILNPGIETRCNREVAQRKQAKRTDSFKLIMQEAFETFEHKYRYTPRVKELWQYIIENSNGEWSVDYSEDHIITNNNKVDYDNFRNRYARFF